MHCFYTGHTPTTTLDGLKPHSVDTLESVSMASGDVRANARGQFVGVGNLVQFFVLIHLDTSQFTLKVIQCVQGILESTRKAAYSTRVTNQTGFGRETDYSRRRDAMLRALRVTSRSDLIRVYTCRF